MNEASPEDIQLLERWLEESEENRIHFEEIRDTWHSVEVEDALSEDVVNQDLGRVLNRIEDSSTEKQGIIRSLFGNWMLRGAAVFVLGVAAAWLLFQGGVLKNSNDAALMMVETPRGSKATVLLSDGSRVVLNADSKLRYPREFSRNERSVFLEGEAYFDITKDRKRQFLVKTSDMTVKVYGTSFNVKSYPGENTTEATLVEGSISIFKHDTNGEMLKEEYKMKPNQRMVLYKEQTQETVEVEEIKKAEVLPERKAKLVLTRRIDTDKFVSWKDGELKIEQESLLDISATLERRYDVTIHFSDDKIKEYRFTGIFHNETIEQVMAAIAFAAPIKYRIEERDIWIDKKYN